MAMRARLLSGALLLVFAIAADALAAEPVYYLALGDSLAIGVQPAQDGSLVPTNQGYVDDLYAFYRPRNPGLQMVKLGCSGETTSSMITGVESPCVYASGSQLSAAVAFLQTHRVALITLDIGGDNLLHCVNLSAPIDPACVSAESATAASDLATILGTLHAYAPGVVIAGMNYYDPFLAAWIFGPNGPAFAAASLLANTAFNNALATIYQLLNVRMADVASAYRTSTFPTNVLAALAWTWMGARPPRGPDVHPNGVGYAVIAGAFVKAIGAR
jgi:lysophospholipase L1-like esterase